MTPSQIILFQATSLEGEIINLLFVGAVDEHGNIYETSRQLPYTEDDDQTYDGVRATDAELIALPRINYNPDTGEKLSPSPIGTYKVIKVLQ